MKIGLSLKPNHHKEIKLAQIRETLCNMRQIFVILSLILVEFGLN